MQLTDGNLRGRVAGSDATVLAFEIAILSIDIRRHLHLSESLAR
jgi:hypothetical protein